MSALGLKELSREIQKIDFGMLSTRGASDTISSRPMSNNGDVEYDGDTWFFSYEDSRKVIDIDNNPNVSLTFTAPPSLFGKPGIFIAIEGRATIIRSRESFSEHWAPGLDAWFPQGVETPGLVLIRVRAVNIEYWDGNENERFSLQYGSTNRLDE